MVTKWLKSGSEQEQNRHIATIAAITFALEVESLTPGLLAILWNKSGARRGLCVRKATVPGHPGTDSPEFKKFESTLKRITEMWHLNREPYDNSPPMGSFLHEVRNKHNVGVLDGKIVLIDIDQQCWSDCRVLKKARQCVLDRLSMPFKTDT